jgi:Ca2+-binding RTX toxin-like protein
MMDIIGTPVNDTLEGSTTPYRQGREDFHIEGLAGNDKLFGSFGDDQLLGGPGNDDLVGNAGDDGLTGGTGGDDFAFGGSDGEDVIFDFTPGTAAQPVDKIVLLNGTPDDIAFTIKNVDENQMGDAVLTYGTTMITLSGVEPVDVDNFWFITG